MCARACVCACIHSHIRVMDKITFTSDLYFSDYNNTNFLFFDEGINLGKCPFVGNSLHFKTYHRHHPFYEKCI